MLVALALVRAKPIERKLALSVTALLAGARFVLKQRVIFSFMLLDFGATFFGNGNALYPIFARDILEVGELGLGFMYAAPAVGAVVRPSWLSQRQGEDTSGHEGASCAALCGTIQRWRVVLSSRYFSDVDGDPQKRRWNGGPVLDWASVLFGEQGL